jgi:diguanylate cyclase (GGDEF)-like protein/PAS domain S-box-containing protein
VVGEKDDAVRGWIGAATDVTERKRQDEAIRLQADQYATILSASADGFILTDASGRLIDVNDAACRMSGFSRTELLTISIAEFEAVETVEETRRRLEMICRMGYDHFETRFCRKDGSVFDVEVSAAYWSATRRLIVFLRDITERKRAEEALRESDVKLREAQEMAEVGSWDWDLVTNTIIWSEEESRLLGRDVDAPPPTVADFFACVHPDDRKKLADGVAEVRRTGAPFQLEYQIMQPSGEVRIVDARMKGYFGPDGKPRRISGTVHDITRAKQSEERLKGASLYARSLIEASLDPIMTVSPEGKITDINEAAVRALDKPRETIIASDFASYFTEPDRAQVACRTVLATGYVTNYQLTIRQSSDELIHVLLNASIYRNPQGEPEGVFAAARDVTEQRRRTEELARLHEQMTATVAELKQREQDTAIIDELSETLQTCKTRNEAYPLIGMAGKQLFPWSNGGLAVFVSSAHELQTVTTWGDKPLMVPEFILEDCWALRRGQLHQVVSSGSGALCRHLDDQPAGPYLCLPLAIPEEALGMLHLNASGPRQFDESVRRLVITLGDVVKLSLSNLKLRETLRLQAIRDPLTQLFNRQYLNETLPREIQRAQRQGLPLCLAMFDVDHFKQFNDRHGHNAGDLVLKWVGELLRKAVRGSDIACRYGGEEFLFVLPECDLSVAQLRVQQICEELRSRECVFHGRSLPAITISVGLVELSEQTPNDAELIAAADLALYGAKNAGRDRICIYSRDMK